VLAAPASLQQHHCRLACTFLEFLPSGHRALWSWCWSFSCTNLRKISWPNNPRWKKYHFSCARYPCCPAATVQPVGACVPENPLLYLSNTFTHLCILSLHMFLKDGSSKCSMMDEL
jgi:hypothetical protein